MADLLPVAHRLVSAQPDKRWPCCTFVFHVLKAAYGLDHRESGEWYRRVNIYDPEEPWSTIDAIVESPGGTVVDRPRVGHWHVCQTWYTLGPDGLPRRYPKTGKAIDEGHTWMWFASSSAEGMRLESSVGKGPRLNGKLLRLWERDERPVQPWNPPSGTTRIVVIDRESTCPM